MKTSYFFIIIFLFATSYARAQSTVLYKQIDTTQLFLEYHYPPTVDSTKIYPAIIFFFGGGWQGGNRQHFIYHATYFSQRGMVAILADYRIKKIHGTTPFEALEDAKSVIRFVRQRATHYLIDPSKIIASGGSAGGHLAAATAFTHDYNAPSDSLAISCIPDALILFNPVIDNGPGGYGHERIGEAYLQFSPLHNIRQGAPPTIFFLGTEDPLIPTTTAQYFKLVMEKVGSRCDLHLYEG